MLLAALFVSLFGCYGFVQFEPVADPKIVVEGGKRSLILPAQFQQAVQVNFPDFGMATEADMTGPWADAGFPFITWGDFNGDGLTDIVVILFNDEAWRLSIFHKTAQGYEIAYQLGGGFIEDDIVPGPQAYFVYLTPKGESISRQRYDEDEDVTSTVEHTFEFDSIYWGVIETYGEYIFWQNGKYEDISFGS